jgi:hypothetical protein
MLTVLLVTERAMLAGTPGQRIAARNQGVPWVPIAMGEVLGSGTASSTLSNLETRRLVCCLATGEGRGRRVSHVKLSAHAVEVAEHWEQYRQSKEQRRRWLSKLGRDWNHIEPDERAEIQVFIKAEDAARVARYSLGNIYQSAALKAVPDDE